IASHFRLAFLFLVVSEPKDARHFRMKPLITAPLSWRSPGNHKNDKYSSPPSTHSSILTNFIATGKRISTSVPFWFKTFALQSEEGRWIGQHCCGNSCDLVQELA